MECLVCAGEARDLTPTEFRWLRHWVPELRQLRSRRRHLGAAPECLSAGTRRGAGKSGVAQRRREMANDQKHLLLIAARRGRGGNQSSVKAMISLPRLKLNAALPPAPTTIYCFPSTA